MSTWDRQYDGFCEYIANGRPEVFNVITSVFILFIGIWGLFINSLRSELVRFIYALFIMTGCGSIGLHVTGYNFWSKMDAFPMLILCYTMNYITWSAVFYTFLRPKSKILDLCHDFTMLVTMGFCLTWTLSARAVRGYPYDIELELEQYFAFPVLSSCVGAVILYIYYRRNNCNRRILTYFLIGIGSLVFSSVLWLAIEPECQEARDAGKKDFSPFFNYSHGIWHVGVSYGAHLLIQNILYLKYFIKQERPIFRSGFIYKIFPLVELE